MPSAALQAWSSIRLGLLDEIEAAHASIGGKGRGRRYATEQLNHAYAVLLSSHFQGFCRDLHTESVEHLVNAVEPASLQDVFETEYRLHRRLDTGNPNPGNIGSDFNRLGVDFWDEVRTCDARTNSRLSRLEALNRWRNAIAHQDFHAAVSGGTTYLRLGTIREWRSACEGLATSFDRVMRGHIQLHIGTQPWT
jgi:hypothetical protein